MSDVCQISGNLYIVGDLVTVIHPFEERFAAHGHDSNLLARSRVHQRCGHARWISTDRVGTRRRLADDLVGHRRQLRRLAEAVAEHGGSTTLGLGSRSRRQEA